MNTMNERRESKPYLSPNIRKVMTTIVKSLTNKLILNGHSPHGLTEKQVRLLMEHPLKDALVKFHMAFEPCDEATAQDIVGASLYYGAGIKKVPCVVFLGTKNYPDFVYEFQGKRIAIEVKKGSNGSKLREGIGQVIVNSIKYGYSVCIFVDDVGDIKKAFDIENDSKRLAEILEKQYNTFFEVVKI